MGGAQPLAVTMNGGVVICIECDPARIQRRIDHRYLDVEAPALEEALQLAVAARDAKRPLSIGVLGNAAEMLPGAARDGRPDRHRHRPDLGARPAVLPPGGRRLRGLGARAHRGPGRLHQARPGVDGRPRARDGGVPGQGAEVFDYGNSIRDEARKGGYDRAFEFPGFVPAYIRPLFCEGKGPFRWAALSGDPEDIAATDKAMLELFPENERLRSGSPWPASGCAFQGLPARICWLGYGERHLAGLKFNEMVASGELKAPIVIGRDHLDCGSVASPNRETEAMQDGSDAIADWAILNALVNTARAPPGCRPPRRRRRHRPLAARRPGHRRRRHRAGRAADRAGADHRPGHGRDPARRRGLHRAVEVAEERDVRCRCRRARPRSRRASPNGGARTRAARYRRGVTGDDTSLPRRSPR